MGGDEEGVQGVCDDDDDCDDIECVGSSAACYTATGVTLGDSDIPSDIWIYYK